MTTRTKRMKRMPALLFHAMPEKNLLARSESAKSGDQQTKSNTL